MTNTTYDLKPGYYWKVAPSTNPDRGAAIHLMMSCTSWTGDLFVAGYHLGRQPSDPEAELEKAMSRIKEYRPTLFADYDEDIENYSEALKNITSSVLP